MSTWTLISVKHRRTVEGTLAEAIEAAKADEESLQPSFGVTIEDEAGATVAEVQDGQVSE